MSAETKVLDLSCSYRLLHNAIMHTTIDPHTCREISDSDDGTLEKSCHFCSLAFNDLSISVLSLKRILSQALSWYYMHKSMHAISRKASINVDEFPFLSMATSQIFDHNRTTTSCIMEEISTHYQRVDEVLKSWNQSRVPVSPDGNCLFYSVLYNARVQCENNNSELEQVLNTNGISILSDSKSNATILRHLVVKEWLENAWYYKSFLAHEEDQFDVRVEAFKQDGHFASNIGDLVITAISNVLKTSIVLLTSNSDMPVHVQPPTLSTMINPHPIYVVYMQYGAGHYDAVIPVKDLGVNTVETLPSTSTDAIKSSVEQTCNCGRKSANGQSCVFSLFQYSCRCPCYNSKQSCKAKSRCKNCANPFGVREKQAPNIGSKRKRTPHENQKFPLQGKRTKTFMEAIGEPLAIYWWL